MIHTDGHATIANAPRKRLSADERSALKRRIDNAKREDVRAKRVEARATFRAMSELMQQTSGPCG